MLLGYPHFGNKNLVIYYYAIFFWHAPIVLSYGKLDTHGDDGNQYSLAILSSPRRWSLSRPGRYR